MACRGGRLLQDGMRAREPPQEAATMRVEERLVAERGADRAECEHAHRVQLAVRHQRGRADVGDLALDDGRQHDAVVRQEPHHARFVHGIDRSTRASLRA